MRNSTLVRCGVGTSILASLAILVGCFESKHPLAPRPTGTNVVDARLLGDWTLEQLDPDDGQVNVTRLVVRNLRGEEYYIEWMTGNEDDDRFRAVGYLTDVGGVRFANLVPLTDTPQPADRYTILRVELDDGKLKLQNLDGEFFKDKRYESPDALRAIVADNLENTAMYKGEPLYGKKVK